MSSQTEFSFQVNWLDSDDGKNADPLLVTSFRGIEEIERTYEYRISLISRAEPAKFRNILRRHARLEIRHEVKTRGGTGRSTRRVHGMLRSFELRGHDGTSYQYHAVLVPRLWRASQARRSRVFVDKPLWDILQATFNAQTGVDVVFERDRVSGGLNPTRAFTMQFNERDLDFLARWLEFYGVSYYFRQEEDNEVAVFTNAREGFPALPVGSDNTLAYVREHEADRAREAVRSVKWREALVPEVLTIADFKADAPAEPFRESIDVGTPGTGTHVEIDSDTSTFDHNDILEIRRDEQHGLNYRLYGESDVRAMAAGYVVKLSPNPVDAAGTEYLLVRVTHSGTQSVDISSGKGSGAQYRNEWVAIPNVLVYRPPRRTPRPQVVGLLHGVVENEDGSDYPGIDGDGYYRVRLFFDHGSSTNSASCPIRKMEPYGGPDRGMHMPLINGTEVVVAFSGGDPDRPLIVGALAGPTQASPVINTNRDQTMIRTKATRIVMQDLQSEESITLSTDGTFAGVGLGPLTDASFQVGTSAKSLSNISSLAAMDTQIALLTKVMQGVVGVSIGSMRQVSIVSGHPLIQAAIATLMTSLAIGYKYETDAKRSGSQPAGVAHIVMPILNLVITLAIVQVQTKLLARTIEKGIKVKLTPRGGKWPARGKRILNSSSALIAGVKKAASFMAALVTLKGFQEAVSRAKSIDGGPEEEEIHGISLVRSGSGAQLHMLGSGKSIFIATDSGSIDFVADRDITNHANYWLATAHLALVMQVIGQDNQPAGCGLEISTSNAGLLGPGDFPPTSVRVGKDFASIGYKVHGAYSPTSQGTGIIIKDGETTITSKETVIETNDHKIGVYVGAAGAGVFGGDKDIVIQSKAGKVTLSSGGIEVVDMQGKGITLQAKGKVTIEASQALELSGAQVKIGGNSVAIDGPNVKINGQGMAAMGGSAPVPPVVLPAVPAVAPPLVPSPPAVSEQAVDSVDAAAVSRVSQLINFFKNRL
ncbi:MAG: type VI secretion system tip protein VgrG [Planctomycetes bacterium]|nr:type VI secretion system tip protein VgrG [Planctomycetota bacterium]MCW8136123.1 type VI secretion system tip protein VgrG [Planctomycetota bacterium]